MARRSDRWWILATGITLALVIGAMFGLTRYKNTPGAPASAPDRWPADSRIEPASDQPVLLMFAHPMCPCTRASMAVLRVIASRCGARARICVLFALPDGVDEASMQSDSWSIAASIPGVVVLKDSASCEAALFGAHTSGQVVLYGADNGLLFSGGITGGRGHEGDNPGMQQVVSLIADAGERRGSYPVFGCSLDNPRAESETLR